jgi:hypothetical protein
MRLGQAKNLSSKTRPLSTLAAAPALGRAAQAMRRAAERSRFAACSRR